MRSVAAKASDVTGGSCSVIAYSNGVGSGVGSGKNGSSGAGDTGARTPLVTSRGAEATGGGSTVIASREGRIDARSTNATLHVALQK